MRGVGTGVRKGYAQFKESVEAGALERSGMWIRCVDTTCFGVVELLTTFGRDVCTELRDLKVVDEPGADSEGWRQFQQRQQQEQQQEQGPENAGFGPRGAGESEGGAEDGGWGWDDGKASDTTCVVPPASVAPRTTRLETNAVIALIRQSRHLRTLKLGGEMMSMIDDIRLHILDAIPASVEQLELWDWATPRTEDEDLPQQFHEFTLQQRRLPTATLHSLTRLALVRGVVHDGNGTLTRLLERCPRLETLCLNDQEYLDSESYRSVATTIRQFCPRLTGLHLISCAIPTEEDLCGLIEACVGLKDFGYPCPPEQKCVFGESAAEALLKHCETLENLRLDGCTRFPSAAIQKMLCSARRLKRFDAVSRFRFKRLDVVLDAKDIVQSDGEDTEKAEWVCLGLESFKCRIGGIPRPDLLTRTNGRPLTDPLHISSTREESLQVQHEIYSRLGKLSHLRELVLGHHEVKPDYLMILDEMDSEGEYYEIYTPNVDIQGGYQYECLEMSLRSGLDRLKGLTELRKCVVEAMAVWFYEAEEQNWAMEWWKKLDWTYQDRFWSDLGYAEYY
ncbi:hypothetical protein BGX33_011313 [Mortierella sp. NVP41]|nr:hypothetical protein BGX33_011313 [Mortierella sp. NVP41]